MILCSGGQQVLEGLKVYRLDKVIIETSMFRAAAGHGAAHAGRYRDLRGSPPVRPLCDRGHTQIAHTFVACRAS